MDRNEWNQLQDGRNSQVALRKESVDRNLAWHCIREDVSVALRKESVDRNFDAVQIVIVVVQSLSARRAWIEIMGRYEEPFRSRKSLSARRAWIEITFFYNILQRIHIVALRKESVDRNTN